jgi:NAD(P)-dependent dehydrogenase (short-subunit alcohol dehydrogenase family)
VTGGSKGIGREVVSVFSENNYRVLLLDKNEKLGLEVEESTDNVYYLKCDVQSENDWKQVSNYVKENMPDLNTVVNCAGLYLVKSLEDSTLEDFHSIMNVNALGTFLSMKYLMPFLLKNKGPTIVNFSSTVHNKGAKRLSVYSASKAAIIGLSKAVASEFASQGLRVNIVIPGRIETDMLRMNAENNSIELSSMRDKVPLGRIGHPRDIAETVLFLSSENSSFITGGEFVVDGGENSLYM